MSGYLIYHPLRQISTFGDYKVYHDPIRQSNQDPYVWNKQFLHTYCHITQMRSEINTINFWVTWDTFPNFSHLYCDLVFVVQNKCFWKERNHIDCTDPIVDSKEAFNDHYQWPACGEHVFTKRKRFTLKAHPECSFQPQDANKERIDVVPFLLNEGLLLDELHQKSRAGFNSQPFYLDDGIANSLYKWLERQASIKLTGNVLECIRQNNPQLASFACDKHYQG